jgi:uncharacterized protein YqgQ
VTLPRFADTENYKKDKQMDIEIVIAELMKLFHVESVTPSQYAEAVRILSGLQLPKLNIPSRSKDLSAKQVKTDTPEA